MDKKVRAKFRVTQKTEREGGYEVQMAPDTRDAEGFWKWTPYGELRMGLVAEDTVDFFEVDKEYYLDFVRKEDGE